MKNLIIILFFITAGLTKLSAQQPAVIVSDKLGWHKIGETTIDFKTETDEIIPIGADRFAFIKFKVADAPINLVSLDIYFESGDKQNVGIGKEIKAPGETRTIELNGGERSLKKITFVYKTLPNNNDKKAHIELWGLKTNKK